ncbi:MAG: thiamine phosphate synthase [Gammaproteobacteria bacterium]|nr:thiamine phosphate synthase [Gammaproteobacteria bacterium]
MLKLAGIYAVTDEQLITEEKFNRAIEAALQGGVKIIQYRDKSNDRQKRFKQAKNLCSLCRQYEAISIINDDLELAKTVNADGVHLGKNDASLKEARQTLGSDAIIGVSCYNSLSTALLAEKNTANYVAFGTMFPSPTKPDAKPADLNIISEAKQQISIPVCAIGGITEKNIQQLVQQDIDMTAVISSLFSTSDIKATANALSKHFT